MIKVSMVVPALAIAVSLILPSNSDAQRIGVEQGTILGTISDFAAVIVTNRSGRSVAARDLTLHSENVAVREPWAQSGRSVGPMEASVSCRDQFPRFCQPVTGPGAGFVVDELVVTGPEATVFVKAWFLAGSDPSRRMLAAKGFWLTLRQGSNGQWAIVDARPGADEDY